MKDENYEKLNRVAIIILILFFIVLLCVFVGFALNPPPIMRGS